MFCMKLCFVYCAFPEYKKGKNPESLTSLSGFQNCFLLSLHLIGPTDWYWTEEITNQN